MSIAALVRSMATAGAPPEAIALAVEAVEAAEAKVEAGRAAARERKRRQRAGTVTGQSRDEVGTVTDAPPPLSFPPQTPPNHTPPPGDITTRARGAAVGPTKTEIARGFLAFWSAYPKRVGKDAAAKSFAKAMARVTDADPLAVILAGLERALPGWDDPQFIPNPTTWLNQGRWDDDAPQPRTGTQNANRPPRQADRSESRSVWADIIAERDGADVGPVQPLRLAG